MEYFQQGQSERKWERTILQMFKEGSSLKITHEMFGLNSEDLILAPGLIINIIPFWAMNPFLFF